MTKLFAPGVIVPQNERLVTSWQIPALLTFTALTFTLSWGLGAISVGIGPTAPGMAAALLTLCGFGPSLAAILIVLVFDGWHGLGVWLRRCLTWRLHPGWYGAAFVAPPLAMLAALGLHTAIGGAQPISPVAGDPGLAITTFALVLLIGGPLSEEFGWRGYALPVLAGRFGWRRASLIIGVVWGLWHVPLFFVADTLQARMPLGLFLAGTVAMSVCFSRLAVNTGFSVLPAIVLHWSINAWAWALAVTPQDGVLQPYVLTIGILCMIATVVFLKPGPPLAQAGVR